MTDRKRKKGEERQDLQNVCNSIEFEDISFEHWESIETKLDLTVPVWISSDMAQHPGKVEVFYSRCESGKRKKAQTTIEWTEICEEGQKFYLRGLGDSSESKQGDLYVIIRFRK